MKHNHVESTSCARVARAVRPMAVALSAFAFAMQSVRPALAGQDYRGAWALESARPTIDAYLRVSKRGPLRATFDIWEQRDGKTLRAYDSEMTKLVHLVVVASDFSSFAHLHPTLLPSGHFMLRVTLPKPTTYLIYADTLPHGEAQAVFRFRVPFGSATSTQKPVAVGRTLANAGPYVVRLNTMAHAPGSEPAIVASISKNGAPAADIRPYLGAAAHVVLIDTRTLDYVHVHPQIGTSDRDEKPAESMAAMPGMHGMTAMPVLPSNTHVPARMLMHVATAGSDTYRLWFQFRGGNEIRVASFLLKSQ